MGGGADCEFGPVAVDPPLSPGPPNPGPAIGGGEITAPSPLKPGCVTSVRFVAELDPTAREALDGLGRRSRFDAGTMLFLEGDVGTRVVVIHSGYVKIVATSEDGHTMVLAVRGPGEVLGDLSAIDGKPRSASAIALEPVDAQVMTADDFRRLLVETPGAAFALLRVVISRMRESDRRRVEYGASDTLGRVALRLVELAETRGESDRRRDPDRHVAHPGGPCRMGRGIPGGGRPRVGITPTARPDPDRPA